jgi:cytochrome c oxidase cbb3-type subunit 3
MNTSNSHKHEHQPDQLLGHSDEADGIEEYDNDLPAWWVWLFYGTVAIAVWVFVDWHVVSPKSLSGLYSEEVAIAGEMFPELVPVAVVINDETIAAGAALYASNCVACHEANGTGSIGPNLVDAEWIHGGSPDEIRDTIFFGVEGKPMIGWARNLGADSVSSLAAYVHSLGGGQ